METRIFVFFGGDFFKLLLISQAVKLCVGVKLLLEMVRDSVARNEDDDGCGKQIYIQGQRI